MIGFPGWLTDAGIYVPQKNVTLVRINIEKNVTMYLTKAQNNVTVGTPKDGRRENDAVSESI